ncbi:MAG TPA: hypothetical protein DCZ69_06130 [Syntrophobacteraceae bacterium]|nr:hypothetical protein [Syntrophobacteraceae bacterium]
MTSLLFLPLYSAEVKMKFPPLCLRPHWLITSQVRASQEKYSHACHKNSDFALQNHRSTLLMADPCQIKETD